MGQGWAGGFFVDDFRKISECRTFKSCGVFFYLPGLIFTIRDTLISHFDKNTFMPYEFSRKAHEGNYHKTFDYTFHYDDSVVLGDIHRIGKIQTDRYGETTRSNL